jgi:3',5'-cyclic AMP phosphodiesterase CpdA
MAITNFIPGLILAASALSAAEPLFFVQMSDPQFGMYTKNKEFSQETANFEFAMANLNRLRPAFVVVTGDLVNEAGNQLQINEYHRIAAKLDRGIALYSVAGNHDVGNEPTVASLARYRERFGKDYYTFRSGDFLGIVLNSSLIQHPEKAAEEAEKQEAWLMQELKKSRAAGVSKMAVFQHIPFFLERADEADQYFNIPAPIRKRFLELFESYGMNHIFAGHYHRNSYGEAGSLKMVTTGPVGMPLGKETSGIRVVRVSDGVIESHYFGLGNVPSQLDASLFAKPQIK